VDTAMAGVVLEGTALPPLSGSAGALCGRRGVYGAAPAWLRNPSLRKTRSADALQRSARLASTDTAARRVGRPGSRYAPLTVGSCDGSLAGDRMSGREPD
jgi:hypothetical protein